MNDFSDLTPNEVNFLLQKGGKVSYGDKKLFTGERTTVWNFGFIPPEDRTPAQCRALEEMKKDVPVYQLPTRGATSVDKMCSWFFSTRVLGAGKNGKHFITMDQKTGSCVMQGAIQAVRYRNAYEVYAGDLDKVIIPFGGLCYGKSREFGGMNNRGDGSFGDTMAKAMAEIGMPDADNPMFPRYSDQGGNGITWGTNVEYDYSVGRNLKSDQLALGKNHLILKVEQVTSLDQLEAGIMLEMKTATCASNWGGMMSPPVAGGNNPVRLNKRSTTWNHQMSVHGCWIHPSLNRIWFILNSWSNTAHGQPADDSPPGGFWIGDRDMQDIISQREVFFVSSFQGTKLTDLNHYDLMELREQSEGGSISSRNKLFPVN